MGANLALVVGDPRNAALVEEYTGHGADVVVITASTSSSEPIDLAADLIRDRGRIVVVGDVGLGVSRRKAYAEELAVVLSRSYGPGRYDIQYEEKGVDYPIGYCALDRAEKHAGVRQLPGNGCYRRYSSAANKTSALRRGKGVLAVA